MQVASWTVRTVARGASAVLASIARRPARGATQEGCMSHQARPSSTEHSTRLQGDIDAAQAQLLHLKELLLEAQVQADSSNNDADKERHQSDADALQAAIDRATALLQSLLAQQQQERQQSRPPLDLAQLLEQGWSGRSVVDAIKRELAAAIGADKTSPDAATAPQPVLMQAASPVPAEAETLSSPRRSSIDNTSSGSLSTGSQTLVSESPCQPGSVVEAITRELAAAKRTQETSPDASTAQQAPVQAASPVPWSDIDTFIDSCVSPAGRSRFDSSSSSSGSSLMSGLVSAPDLFGYQPGSVVKAIQALQPKETLADSWAEVSEAGPALTRTASLPGAASMGLQTAAVSPSVFSSAAPLRRSSSTGCLVLGPNLLGVDTPPRLSDAAGCLAREASFDSSTDGRDSRSRRRSSSSSDSISDGTEAVTASDDAALLPTPPAATQAAAAAAAAAPSPISSWACPVAKALDLLQRRHGWAGVPAGAVVAFEGGAVQQAPRCM